MAAVGANTYLISLMVNLFVGVSLGANVTIANYFGKGDEDGVTRATHTSIALSLICGTVLLVAGQVLARPVHQAIGTPDELLDQAMLYFRIYYLGMPPIMLYNFASAVLRSKGDTRRPLLVLIVSGVLNVALNLLFVVGLHLDVAGVALATLLSNVASSLALVEMLRREEGIYHLSLRQLHIDREALGGIVRVGLPADVQSSIFSLSNIVLQAAINSLGQTAMAATTVATNFEYFTYNAILGFSQAGTTFVSQNDGAGNHERCRKVTRLTLLLGPMFTLAVGVFFYALRVPFVSLFTTDAAVKPPCLPAHSSRNLLPVGQCRERDLLRRDAWLQALHRACGHQHRGHLRHAHPVGSYRLCHAAHVRAAGAGLPHQLAGRRRGAGCGLCTGHAQHAQCVSGVVPARRAFIKCVTIGGRPWASTISLMFYLRKQGEHQTSHHPKLRT